MGLIAEIFTWIGLGAGIAVLAVAAIVRLADGTWLPARGVVEQTPDGPIVRWFDDEGNVNEASLRGADAARIDGRDMADIHYRHGWHDRMRLDPGSHAVRALMRLALLLLGVGAAAWLVGWVVLVAEG